jgi:lipid-A-disaccharide synthase
VGQGVGTDMSGRYIFMVAGEASGDLHGSRLALELKRLAPDCRLAGIGGPKMRTAGVDLIYSLEDFAFLGFSEVLGHLPFIFGVYRELERLFKQDRPDAVILIDYPGFNIRLAKKLNKKKIPILYYISPQVWAWQPHRARLISQLVDRLVVVLPFESEFYRRRTGRRPHFVGHPLLEVVHANTSREQFCRRWRLRPEHPIIGLFPGSRGQEVERLLPDMLEAGRLLQRKMPSLQVAVGAVSTFSEDRYWQLMRSSDGQTRIVFDAPYELMRHARLLLVASGTATLEAAIMGTPMVVLYRMSTLSWLLALLLVRVPYIGLVNLVAGSKIVPELVQHQVTPSRVARQAWSLIGEGIERQVMLEKLSEIRARLGRTGASRRTAQLTLSLIADGR